MATQKALLLPEVGAEFVLGRAEVPEPGDGEVLVKLEAAALNPIDWKIQKSGFFVIKEYPAILGVDGAGVVQKVGSGVTDLSPGDRILFQTSLVNRYSAFQEYCLTDATLVIKIPSNISFEEATTVASGFVPFAVASYAQRPHGLGLTPPFEEGGLGKYADQPIVIMGGASSIGQFAIQFAKLSGFSPLITTASLRNKDYLESLGATHVLDRNLSAADLNARVAQITDKPIPYIFDAVSYEETQQAALSLLAPGGSLIVATDPLVKADDKHVQQVYGIVHFPQNRALAIAFSSALTEWLAQGKIKPNKVEVLPGGLNGIVSGLKRLAANGVSATKLVVRPADTL